MLLGVVVVLVAGIVWWPEPPAAAAQQGLARFLAVAHIHGLPIWITFQLVEAISNIVMFVPIGFLAALALRRWQWLVVPIGLLASTAIEVSQLLLPDRVASVRDVVTNTLGTLIGYLLALPLVRRRVRRQRRAQLGRRGANDPPRSPVPTG